MNKPRVHVILKVLFHARESGAVGITCGWLSRWTKIPYSNVKRVLDNLVKNGLVEAEFEPYKSTGRFVYSITTQGTRVFIFQRELLSDGSWK